MLHPEDSLPDGDWSRERWDLIVDLGFTSPFTYAELSQKLHTRIVSVYQYDHQTEGHRWADFVLEQGRGKLLDRMGLDWWDIIATGFNRDIYLLYLLTRMRADIPTQISLTASRPHPLARMLGHVLACPVHYRSRGRRSPVRMLRSAWRLRPAQAIEIAFDKWDPTYDFRRKFSRPRRARLSEPAVLIPSAYSNVTRTALGYAAQLPRRHFLLATTRRNALPRRLPENVTATTLAAYATSSDAIKQEIAELRAAWVRFSTGMQRQSEEFRLGAETGLWDHFPLHLSRGLQLRQTWMQLLEREPIRAVLCGDDLNYYTRLPLILAQRTGRNAVYCSHGALDGGFLFKSPQADWHLVKGEMERDYLLRARTMDPERICVAAPGRYGSKGEPAQSRKEIVFFSQPYEVASGRAEAIYREVLPPLCAAAIAAGKRVIVKLHPFESQRERSRLARSILPESKFRLVEFASGSPQQVWPRAWCGVTVDSSVTVEGALRNIPFFLCGWLDFMGMGYVQQFERFGVGRVLSAPKEVEGIPEMVTAFRPDPATHERLWHEADPAQLDEILFGSKRVHQHSCAC